MRLLQVGYGSCRRVDDPDALRAARIHMLPVSCFPRVSIKRSILASQLFGGSLQSKQFRDVLIAERHVRHRREFLEMRQFPCGP